jgi:hypothetical protein
MTGVQPATGCYAFESDGKSYVIDHPSLADHYKLAARIAAAHAHIEMSWMQSYGK